MKLLIDKNSGYKQQLEFLNTIEGNYDGHVIFHCYWNGILNEKHLISIRSCYYFNIYKRTNKKIILWIENNTSNKFNLEISKYCEIKLFDISNEVRNTFLQDKKINYVGGSAGGLSEKANFYRLVLLYNYGGCWFDLDIFFLRNFEPLFSTFKNTNLLYQWEYRNYPNNGICISLEINNANIKNTIEFIINRDNGWGFQRAKLTYDLPLDITVLPCITFDPGWINSDFSKRDQWSNIFFDESRYKGINLESFYKGCFAYHWHNRWNRKIHDNSIIRKLDNEIIELLV